MANAPTFMSGLSGFFGGGSQQQPGGHQEPHMEDEPEEIVEPGVGDIMQEMFTLPDEGEEEETPPGPVLGPDGKPLPTPQQKLAQTIQETIAKMGAPELPADFDPTNPKHLTDFIAKSNQATALATIQMSFQPMQMAMEEMMTKMSERIEAKINGFGSQQSEASILKGLVPEAEDPQYAGLVTTLFAQSKKSKGAAGDPKLAAAMVRKALDTMGIKSTKAADPFSGSSFKTGAAALDAYGPIPVRKPASKPASS